MELPQCTQRLSSVRKGDPYMKKTIILLITLALLLTFVGCQGGITPKSEASEDRGKTSVVPNETESHENHQDISIVPNIIESGEADWDKYDTAGKIHKIEGETLSILSGDIMKDVTVEGAEHCYVGETVGVIKNGDSYTVEKILVDQTIRHTTMGDMIHLAEGEIKEVSDKYVILTTKDGDIKLETYDILSVKEGDLVMVDYLVRETNQLLSIYHKDTVITASVTGTERDAETGEMIVHIKDDKNAEYSITIKADTVANFNLSELISGDKLAVYPATINEENPTVINAMMIMRLDSEGAN